ncbi:MAG: BrnA antitoxin family protein [Microthrixaceae bacterium]
MKKGAAERYREIDFSRAKRGAVVKAEPGKTKISIRLSNAVLEYFRDRVDKAGGGNYQTRINEALLEHIHRGSALDSMRQVLREELASYGAENTRNPSRGAHPRRRRAAGPGGRAR